MHRVFGGALQLLLEELDVNSVQSLLNVLLDLLQREGTDYTVSVDVEVSREECGFKLEGLQEVPHAEKFNGLAWLEYFGGNAWLLFFFLLTLDLRLGLVWLATSVSDMKDLLISDGVVHEISLVYHLCIHRPDNFKTDTIVAVRLHVNVLEVESIIKHSRLQRPRSLKLSAEFDELVLGAASKHAFDRSSVVHVGGLV